LLIGILIGLEREHWRIEKKVYAGVRTFAITALSGTIASIIAEIVAVEILIITTLFVAVVCIILIYSTNIQHRGSGLTTGIALFLTYLLGIIVANGFFLFAIIVAIIITFLLVQKHQLHTFAENLEESEILSAVKFLAVAFILYPLVPEEALLGIIDLRSVILIIVLVSSISFASYILLKKVGAKGGMSYSGLLGGFVSSEATTGALASLSKIKQEFTDPLIIGIILANIAMLISNIIIAFIVNPSGNISLVMVPPHLIMIIISIYLIYKVRTQTEETESIPEVKETIELESPFALKPAFKFGIIFMVLMVLADVANQVAGPMGIYATALGGIVSSSAVTVSVASLAVTGNVSYLVAAETAVMASIISTFSKLLFIRATGSSDLFNRSKNIFIIIGFVGILILLFHAIFLRVV